MIKLSRIWGLSVLLAFTASACSSGSDNEPTSGVGSLTLSLLPSTSFTRSINETEYTNNNNYTVTLQGEDDTQTFLYRDMPLKMDIQAGSYTLTAHYGHNPVAGLDSLYMEGSTEFTVRTGETKTVNLTCLPANAKIAVKTSSDFAQYFSDYQIDLTTDRMAEGDTLTYGKKEVETDKKDAYVQADKTDGTEVSVRFTLTPAKDVTLTKRLDFITRNVKAQDCLTFTLKPDVTTVEGGTVSGITITIDDALNTEDVNISLPYSWLN